VKAAQPAIDRLMAQPPELGLTLAVMCVHGGEVVAEAYGPDTTADTPLISWSMAKSVTHALLGIAIREGRIDPDLDQPAAVAAWQTDDVDPRRAVTIRHLLTMTSGLRFVEDYVDAGVSHCLDMLFGEGQADVAGYAAALPLDHEPGTFWSYSSGTTNILSRIIGDAVGGGARGMEAFMRDELFGPLGMISADPQFDDAGTFIGSSFLYATTRDYARFGELYLAGGRDILPEGWVDLAATPVPIVPPDELAGYGAHWWLWRDGYFGDEFPGTFAAHGYEGQYIVVAPDRDLVMVRLGKTPAELRPALLPVLREIVAAFPSG
jgi:CubicO group peptidase (beta-lactamase class C family)